MIFNSPVSCDPCDIESNKRLPHQYLRAVAKLGKRLHKSSTAPDDSPDHVRVYLVSRCIISLKYEELDGRSIECFVIEWKILLVSLNNLCRH